MLKIELYTLDENDAWCSTPEVYSLPTVEECCRMAEYRANVHGCRVDVVIAARTGPVVTTCAPGEHAGINPDFAEWIARNRTRV
jgi:hypothetical protein